MERIYSIPKVNNIPRFTLTYQGEGVGSGTSLHIVIFGRDQRVGLCAREKLLSCHKRGI